MVERKDLGWTGFNVLLVMIGITMYAYTADGIGDALFIAFGVGVIGEVATKAVLYYLNTR